MYITDVTANTNVAFEEFGEDMFPFDAGNQSCIILLVMQTAFDTPLEHPFMFEIASAELKSKDLPAPAAVKDQLLRGIAASLEEV